MSHVDEMTCLLYLEGQLDPARARELSAHTDACPECRGLLRALEGESRWLARALAEEDEAVPARLLAPPKRDATPWAWIVSSGLAVAGAYTLWTGFVEPWRQQLSQVGFGGNSLLTMLFFGGVFWKGWGEMANTIEMLAVITLGILALALLRRTWRRWTPLAVVLGALAAALAVPPQAGAAELKHTESYVLPKDAVVHNDLIVAAESVRIDGEVQGDLIAFSKTLTVNGHVTGDVISFGQISRIHGRVDGNLRVFANALVFSGTVARNASVFAGNIDADTNSQIAGSLTAFSGDATLSGRIGRDFLGFAGRTTLDGSIGGSARFAGDRLTIDAGAEIRGPASYKGPHQPRVDSAAKLASPLAVEIVHHRPNYASPRYFFHQALFWGAAFLFGLVLALLLPRLFSGGVQASNEYLLSPLVGVGVLCGVPFLALVACVTIVGLAVGIATILIWLVALYAAQTFVGTWLGEQLLGAASGTGPILGRLAVGLAVLRIAFLLPYVGPWIKFIVLLWGLGALGLALYRRAQPMRLAQSPASS